MLRPSMLWLLLLQLSLLILPVSFTYANPTTTTVQIAELQQLQKTITADIKTLSNVNGEMKQFVEYRVKQHTAQFHNQMTLLMANTNVDNSNLQPLIEQHLTFINQVDRYFTHNIEQFKSKLSLQNNGQLMSNMADRESERDDFLKGKLQTLNWLQSLNQDINQQKSELTTQLLQRADLLNSLVKFTQTQLQSATNTVTNTGPDVSAEQTALVAKLKQRLSLTSNSLSVTINLLDQLEQDTSSLKQTLFSICFKLEVSCSS